MITPPFQGADEMSHYVRAYQISQGNLIVDTNAEGVVGGELPTSIDEIASITGRPSIQFHPELKYDLRQTKRALAVRDVEGQNKFYDFANTAAYSPVPYAPSAVGIGVARTLHLPPLVTLYAGRLGNLLAWVGLIALAIRLIPARKWAVVAVGLLPMGLFQASMLNGDVVTFGSLAVFLALILYYRERKTVVSIKEILFLMATAAAMVLSKNVMFVLLPLVLLLHKQNFVSARIAWISKMSLIFVPLFVYACWFLVVQSIDVQSTYVHGQDPAAQLSLILRNPLEFVAVMWNTYFFTWGDYITKSFIGVFGWADTPLSEGIIVIGYISLFIILAGSYESNYKEQISKKGKQLVALLAAVYFLAASAALYVYYSPVGFGIIYGLQGRYYLPIAFALIPIVRMRKIIIDNTLYKRLAMALPVFLLVASVITIVNRYYLPNI